MIRKGPVQDHRVCTVCSLSVFTRVVLTGKLDYLTRNPLCESDLCGFCSMLKPPGERNSCALRSALSSKHDMLKKLHKAARELCHVFLFTDKLPLEGLGGHPFSKQQLCYCSIIRLQLLCQPSTESWASQTVAKAQTWKTSIFLQGHRGQAAEWYSWCHSDIGMPLKRLSPL